jgi:hypothetical protein
LAVQALNIATGDFFPTNWTAEHVIVSLANDNQNISELGRSGELYWISQEISVGSADSSQRFPLYTLMWGRAGSRWTFGISADTREDLEPLLAAFVQAAQR